MHYLENYDSDDYISKLEEKKVSGSVQPSSEKEDVAKDNQPKNVSLVEVKTSSDHSTTSNQESSLAENVSNLEVEVVAGKKRKRQKDHQETSSNKVVAAVVESNEEGTDAKLPTLKKALTNPMLTSVQTILDAYLTYMKSLAELKNYNLEVERNKLNFDMTLTKALILGELPQNMIDWIKHNTDKMKE